MAHHISYCHGVTTSALNIFIISSYTKKVNAAEGATFSELGTTPLKKPTIPSDLKYIQNSKYVGTDEYQANIVVVSNQMVLLQTVHRYLQTFATQSIVPLYLRSATRVSTFIMSRCCNLLFTN